MLEVFDFCLTQQPWKDCLALLIKKKKKSQHYVTVAEL